MNSHKQKLSSKKNELSYENLIRTSLEISYWSKSMKTHASYVAKSMNSHNEIFYDNYADKNASNLTRKAHNSPQKTGKSR